MDSWPDLLLTSCVRERKGYTDAFDLAAQSWQDALDEYPGNAGSLLLLHLDTPHMDRPSDMADTLDALPGLDWHALNIQSPEDSRDLGGPRCTGWSQMVLAFLRSWLFQEWAQTSYDMMLQVDSDVELHPGALEKAVRYWTAVAESSHPASSRRVTLSLQINNNPFEGEEPATNAMVEGEDGYELAPWADDGSMIEVARSGACTLYPREALRFRPMWKPGYREEHQIMFDEMSEEGWLHLLLRDPDLTTHHMKREPTLAEIRRELIARRGEG